MNPYEILGSLIQNGMGASSGRLNHSLGNEGLGGAGGFPGAGSGAGYGGGGGMPGAGGGLFDILGKVLGGASAAPSAAPGPRHRAGSFCASTAPIWITVT